MADKQNESRVLDEGIIEDKRMKFAEKKAEFTERAEQLREQLDLEPETIESYGGKPNGVGALSVKIDVDVSDAITGMKALQREAKKATQALKETEVASKTLRVIETHGNVINVMMADTRELIVSIGEDNAVVHNDYLVEYGEQAMRESESATYGKRLSDANEMLSRQGESGNYDYDEYMHGMYNGMEVVLATIEDREPVFKDAPTTFLAPYSDIAKLTTKVLSEELEKREGITTYELGGYGNYANLQMVSADGGDSVFIAGPAIITVNID